MHFSGYENAGKKVQFYRMKVLTISGCAQISKNFPQADLIAGSGLVNLLCHISESGETS